LRFSVTKRFQDADHDAVIQDLETHGEYEVATEFIFGEALGVLSKKNLKTRCLQHAANKYTKQVEQLKQRLQLGYEATEEAREYVAAQEFSQAADAFMDALNLGRKSALALQELELTTDDDNNAAADESLSSELPKEALQWLVDVVVNRPCSN
jgi:hypothetical protein